MTNARLFRGYRFPAEVILWAVRWYLQFPVSYRNLERMLADRGVAVDHVTMYRWVQRFAPELERRLRRQVGPGRGAHLALGQHRHRLHTRQRPPRRPKALEAEHRPCSALDPAVVLLDPIVEPAAAPVPGEAPGHRQLDGRPTDR